MDMNEKEAKEKISKEVFDTVSIFLLKNSAVAAVVFIIIVSMMTACKMDGPVTAATPVPTVSDYNCVTADLGISFLPVADITQQNFSAAHITPLNLKRFRFAEDWKIREPVQGVRNWDGFDSRIQFAYENGLSVFLTVQSNGPDWASVTANARSSVFANDSEFAGYAADLVARSNGKVDKIQFGNEWMTSYWYIGTGDDFVRFNNILYAEAKAVNPGIKVVLGGFSTGVIGILSLVYGRTTQFKDDDGIIHYANEVPAFVASAEGSAILSKIETVTKTAQFDMVDLHLYDDPENWQVYIDFFEELFPGKEIIVSEFGGPNLNYEAYTDEYHAKRLLDYIKAIDTAGITEAYYYSLVELSTSSPSHVKSGIIRPDYSLKPGYYVFQNANE